MDRGKLESFVRRLRVDEPGAFRLDRVDAAGTAGLRSKNRARDLLQAGVEWLSDAQEKLYAQDRWSVLLVFQAMDAAGKDGTIRHVFSGLNPQGCQVYSFKAPSAEELDHDFLWRTSCRLPERGRIGIFNRSYYEEVLVVRVHPEMLERQKLPASRIHKKIWKERFEDINAFERYLSRQGLVILKFFLHVSNQEQRRRFLSRLDEPEKHWKFSLADAREREHWDDYMQAYDDAIRSTSTPWAPWHVIPADHKWIARAIVATIITRTIEGLDLEFPKVGPEQKKALAEARKQLEAE
jgi:PPK2 family polyphosphate:nucleotide phosphotransferase